MNERLCSACGERLSDRPAANSGDEHHCGAKQWAAETNRLLRKILELAEHATIQ
jgi:hypothetical protein